MLINIGLDFCAITLTKNVNIIIYFKINIRTWFFLHTLENPLLTNIQPSVVQLLGKIHTHGLNQFNAIKRSWT